MTTTTITSALGALLALTISIPATAWSQERVGVATTVVGPVTLTRVSASPAPLKFKDEIRLNDRIATGEKAFTRLLLGGKAIVTARERSVVTITEVPGTSTIDLLSGRISVAVDKSKMRPGDLIEIKTPNAVSGIRGTIVVAEVLGADSSITVLRGLVDVYRRDPATGNAFGPATPVGVRESLTVKASVLPVRPQTITGDNARKLSNDFTAPVRAILPASTMSVSDEMTRAKDLMSALTQTSGRGRDDATPGKANRDRGDKDDKNDRNDAPMSKADKGGNGRSTTTVSGGASSAAPAAVSGGAPSSAPAAMSGGALSAAPAAMSGGAPSAAPAALSAAVALPTTNSIPSLGGNSSNGQGRASDNALKNHPFKK